MASDIANLHLIGPQANGQVESTNKVLEAILTQTIHLHHKDWADRLPEA